MTDYSSHIAKSLKIKAAQVSAVIALLDDGNTIPFIARYRKEATTGLDEIQLRAIVSQLDTRRALDARRDTILKAIEEQGKLNAKLRAQFKAATTKTELEDLYQPYKIKRKTRATVARENGLTELAKLIVMQKLTPRSADQLAASFVNDKVSNTEDALAGARDIVAEAISDHPDVRGKTRDQAMRWGKVVSKRVEKTADEKSVFKLYYDSEFGVNRLRPHQILALNRGESAKILRVKVDVGERDWRKAVTSKFRIDKRSPMADQLELAMTDAANRLLLPAIERDVRRTLNEKAEGHAIDVFSTNLRGLLHQPPLSGHVILGLDPAFRTGCKLAVIDATGKLLATDVVYPHAPQKHWNDTLKTLLRLIKKHNITLIAIGNGTASRESEQLVAELTRELPDVQYLIVSEAGASVYSASELAGAELPDLDVSIRGAVSIARRVQDPLAELVKIDPKAIGVGLYQHDIDQKQLTHALDGTVEDVVNQIGVEVNTASPALLTHVAGIGPKLAQNIVSYREENGKFRSRAQLKKVSGLGAKAFEQSAGFLRIQDARDPLDASAIHPESYQAARKLLHRTEAEVGDPALSQKVGSLTDVATELKVGVPTLQDIIEQLQRPGRDPREDAPPPILRSDVLSMDDLLVGMTLKGTVRNLVDFGAFVDIGVKQAGLLHSSQIKKGTLISVGDVVEVEILKVEANRGRIGLKLV